jgi:tellurium resistance protein TerD
MAINLKKGESINLSKREPNLRKIRVGLGWDKKAGSGADFDLDVSVFVPANLTAHASLNC